MAGRKKVLKSDTKVRSDDKPKKNKAKPPLVDKQKSEVCREECIELLNDSGKISDKLASAMKIPEKLFVKGDGFDFISFSSDPKNDLSAIAAHLMLGLPFPKESPEYGIFIGSKSGSIMCILVDKRRKIIVYDSLGSSFAPESSSWDRFQSSLNEALDNAKLLTSEGKRYLFVINGEKSIVID